MHILIIDDDRAFLSTLSRRLEMSGDICVSAFDSVEAAYASDSNNEVDAILLDMQLGKESSLNAIPELKARYSPTHLIVLTGYASIATTVAAIKKGATDYLAKPVSLKEIIHRLSGSAVTEDHNFIPLSPGQVEREHIERVLQENDGNISATATALGMHRRTLQRKLQKFSRGT
ncbi:response regulator transcription factor [Alteromonas antoniana]|uniref:response regulator transcription factor n=1 Tax=Alteromonas antoniana TaxID=2803813 RepID=UPI001C461E07|nr:response regulator [Alteromonas antoniana]